MSNETTITVYSKDHCVQCNAVKKYLDKHSIDYEVLAMDKDDNALAEAKAMGYLQAPVVVVSTVGQEATHFSGFDPNELAKIPR